MIYEHGQHLRPLQWPPSDISFLTVFFDQTQQCVGNGLIGDLIVELMKATLQPEIECRIAFALGRGVRWRSVTLLLRH